MFCQKFVPTTWRKFFKSTCAAGGGGGDNNNNSNNEDGNNNNNNEDDDDDSGEEEVVTVATAPTQRREPRQNHDELTCFTGDNSNGNNNGVSVVKADVEEAAGVNGGSECLRSVYAIRCHIQLGLRVICFDISLCKQPLKGWGLGALATFTVHTLLT